MRFYDLHRCIRSLTRHYPSRHLAPQFTALMGCFVPSHTPLWMVSHPCGRAPCLELNLSNPHQRKIYYFPKAWGNYWLRERFPRFLDHELSPGMLFMDIGAHLGFFSIYAAKLVGSAGAVVAFEPDPDTYESLARSARHNTVNGRIVCANVALSDTNGQAVFYRATKPASSSLVPEKTGHEDRYRDSIPVDCWRLDDYVKEANIDLRKRLLIKVDVEGHEVGVVSGMLGTLADASFPTLWIEVRGPEGSTRAPNTFPEVNRLLSALGYKPYFWIDGMLINVSDVVGRENVVFIHESNDRLSDYVLDSESPLRKAHRKKRMRNAEAADI